MAYKKPTDLNTARNIRKHILANYPLIHKDKLDVLKVGPRTYLVAVTPDGSRLMKAVIFIGTLDAIPTLTPLRRLLDKNIESALIKIGWIRKTETNE
jgi:hypothetical protein